MDTSLSKHYLEDAVANFRGYKKLAEGAFAQVSDEEFFQTLDAEANSIAVIVKHMVGNMLSRWTDFLNSDGEKPDRNRDMEFVITNDTTREEMLAQWEKGWDCVFGAVEALQPEDLMKAVLIRGEAHTVVKAINRQMTHYGYHIGQIVLLAKHFRTTEWKSLSIPRNRSADFNTYLTGKAQNAGGQTQATRFDAPQDFIRETGHEESGDRSQKSE
jgi:Protein of unknown function (DUF1572)